VLKVKTLLFGDKIGPFPRAKSILVHLLGWAPQVWLFSSTGRPVLCLIDPDAQSTTIFWNTYKYFTNRHAAAYQNTSARRRWAPESRFYRRQNLV